MKGGGGGGSQTTRTEPPKYLQPFLQQGMQEARNLYNQGPAEYYPGQTVVGFSPETEAAMGLQADRARTGSPITSAANSFAANTLNSAPSSNFGMGSNPYASSVYTPDSGYIGPINPFSGSAYQAPQGPNPYARAVNSGNGANPYAANTYSEAPTNFGGQVNPYLDRLFNQGADQITNRLQSSFAGSGRNIEAARPVAAEDLGTFGANLYGSAYDADQNRALQAHEGAAGRALSAYEQAQQLGSGSFEAAQARGLNSRLAAQQIGAQGYEAERARQQQAGLMGQQIGADSFEANQGRNFSSIEAGRNRQQDAALAAQQIGATGYESERDRMAQDLQQQRQQQLGVLGLAPSLAQNDYADIDRLSQVGARREDLAGREMQDAMSRWDFGQNAQSTLLDQYLGRLQGFPGSVTTSPSTRNVGAGVLGGAGMGYQLGSQFGYGGLGALFGGLLGGYG